MPEEQLSALPAGELLTVDLMSLIRSDDTTIGEPYSDLLWSGNPAVATVRIVENTIAKKRAYFSGHQRLWVSLCFNRH